MKEVLNFVVKHLSYSEYCNFFGTCQSKKPDMWAHTPQNPNINQLHILKFIFKVIYLEERQAFLIQYLKYCDLTLFSFILIFIKIELSKYTALLDF